MLVHNQMDFLDLFGLSEPLRLAGEGGAEQNEGASRAFITKRGTILDALALCSKIG
jgi:hypothetical protein